MTNAAKATFSVHAFPSVTRLSTFQVVSTNMLWLEDANLDRRWWISDGRIHMPPHYDQLETTSKILLLCRDSEGVDKKNSGDIHDLCRLVEGPAFGTIDQVRLYDGPLELYYWPAAQDDESNLKTLATAPTRRQFHEVDNDLDYWILENTLETSRIFGSW